MDIGMGIVGDMVLRVVANLGGVIGGGIAIRPPPTRAGSGSGVVNVIGWEWRRGANVVSGCGAYLGP